MNKINGPWVARAYANSNECFVAPTAGGTVVHQSIADETGGITPVARLIAAAPELLQVLQDYLDDQDGVKLLNGMDLHRRMIDVVRKARGE